MTNLEKKIEILQDICARLGGNLQGISAARKQGHKEIKEHGEISQDTCETMAQLLEGSESDARSLDTGLKSIHQSFAKYVPDGMNEGPKPWPP